MRKVFFSKDALRYYIHTKHPGAYYMYTKLYFLPVYILEEVI